MSLYNQVRNREALRKAWLKVRSNGKSSKSKDTQLQIREFDRRSDNHLQNIARKLQENRFHFSSAIGVAIPKGVGKGYRPLVISPVEDRIVQRSILDTLQNYDPIKPYFDVDTSFGGISDRSVEDAIAKVYSFIESGNGRYFLRTDIKSFFTKIPKDVVQKIVEGVTDDSKFLSLFESAITTELSNLEQLGKKRELFPIHEIGVAQGSCLSPLMGNIVLAEFDSKMNSNDVLCVRYIDDFIILAPSKQVLGVYLKRANKILTNLGMETYKPHDGSGKCEIGATNLSFSFLGCQISQGKIIRPNRASWKRLLASLKLEFDESKRLMSNPEKMVARNYTLVETIARCSNIVKGWGSQYSFCNDPVLMRQIDEKIDQQISEYLGFYRDKRQRLIKNDLRDGRRLLGLSLISDCKNEPIIPNPNNE